LGQREDRTSLKGKEKINPGGSKGEEHKKKSKRAKLGYERGVEGRKLKRKGNTVAANGVRGGRKKKEDKGEKCRAAEKGQGREPKNTTPSGKKQRRRGGTTAKKKPQRGRGGFPEGGGPASKLGARES